MCFTNPVPTASSCVLSPKSQKGIRKVDDGWTARGPGIWTDEEFSSTDDGLAAPMKQVQKKPLHIIRNERAESTLKRAAMTDAELPSSSRNSAHHLLPKLEAPAIQILQKKRFVVQQAPEVVKKVRDIAYTRSVLMQVRSLGSNAALKPSGPVNVEKNAPRPESSVQLKEPKKQLCVKKAEAKPELLFLRAIRDIRSSA